jgi:hypothetical protein
MNEPTGDEILVKAMQLAQEEWQAVALGLQRARQRTG